MQNIHCKNYNHGKGHCPFGTKCMYRHSLCDDIDDDFESLFDPDSDSDKISVDENEQYLDALNFEMFLAEGDTTYWDDLDESL